MRLVERIEPCQRRGHCGRRRRVFQMGSRQGKYCGTQIEYGGIRAAMFVLSLGGKSKTRGHIKSGKMSKKQTAPGNTIAPKQPTAPKHRKSANGMLCSSVSDSHPPPFDKTILYGVTGQGHQFPTSNDPRGCLDHSTLDHVQLHARVTSKQSMTITLTPSLLLVTTRNCPSGLQLILRTSVSSQSSKGSVMVASTSQFPPTRQIFRHGGGCGVDKMRRGCLRQVL